MIDNGLNVQAFSDFGFYITELTKALHTEDQQKQLIALTQAIDALQEARNTMVGQSGGILN